MTDYYHRYFVKKNLNKQVGNYCFLLAISPFLLVILGLVLSIAFGCEVDFSDPKINPPCLCLGYDIGGFIHLLISLLILAFITIPLGIGGYIGCGRRHDTGHAE